MLFHFFFSLQRDRYEPDDFLFFPNKRSALWTGSVRREMLRARFARAAKSLRAQHDNVRRSYELRELDCFMERMVIRLSEQTASNRCNDRLPLPKFCIGRMEMSSNGLQRKCHKFLPRKIEISQSRNRSDERVVLMH